MAEQPTWMDSLSVLLEQHLAKENFKKQLESLIMQPAAQSIIRMVMPYFVGILLLLSITIVLLGVTLYYIVNYVIDRPKFSFPDMSTIQ